MKKPRAPGACTPSYNARSRARRRGGDESVAGAHRVLRGRLAHLRDIALVLADLEKNGITAEPSKIVLRNAETASYKKDRQLHSLNRPGRLEERNK